MGFFAMRAYFCIAILFVVTESLVRNINTYTRFGLGHSHQWIRRPDHAITSLRGNVAVAIPDGESPADKALNVFKPNGEASRQIESNMKTLPAIIGEWSVTTVKAFADVLATDVKFVDGRSLPVASALQKMKKDMEFLDDIAARTPQLSTVEIVVLVSTVVISAIAPSILSVKVVEVLVPSLAALSASIGISAEYIGKIAVSNGKEIAALAIQVAAESEAILAAAERSKAILPLCVGIATTASAFSLLAPSLINELNFKFGIAVPRELYLIFPLISVLAAAIAGLATQESQGLASRAIGVGNRRFASSKSVGRTWLSATEQVEASSRRISDKWKSFAIGVAPAPVIAAFFPGAVSLKAIVCASLAAAQAAYYLSVAEYSIAQATDAVALKARSAAVTDTYANQGSRAGAILPFTSALAGLCAAASAAMVEILPLVNVEIVQSLLAVIFPSGAALFASAAAVSKARCEFDAAAASAAASFGLAEGVPGNDKQEGKDPWDSVRMLIKTTLRTSVESVKVRVSKIRNSVKKGTVWIRFRQWLKKRFPFFRMKIRPVSKIASANRVDGGRGKEGGGGLGGVSIVLGDNNQVEATSATI